MKACPCCGRKMPEHVEFDLKAFRTSRGMTQTQLAKEIGVALSLVNMVEKGKRGVTPDLYEKLQKLA